jgi:hypothetical protein
MSNYILHDRYYDPEAGRISSYFCRLFVLIRPESLQYCILDTEKNAFIALAEYRIPSALKSNEFPYSQLHNLISGEEALQKKYPSVVIGFDTPFHTLVPSPLFESHMITQYMDFNFRLPDGCQVNADRIEEIDAFNIYGFMPDLNDISRKYFSDAAVVHSTSALIRAMNLDHKNNPDPSTVFLHDRGQFIDLAYFEEGRPVFYNSFPCRSKEDLLYFTLYTLEQLKIRPDSVRLSLSGAIDPGSDSCQLLEQYIRTITFTGPIGSFNYSALLQQAPAHRYRDLFALAL